MAFEFSLNGYNSVDSTQSLGKKYLQLVETHALLINVVTVNRRILMSQTYHTVNGKLAQGYVYGWNNRGAWVPTPSEVIICYSICFGFLSRIYKIYRIRLHLRKTRLI